MILLGKNFLKDLKNFLKICYNKKLKEGVFYAIFNNLVFTF